jgi:hypothetical protein
MPPTDASSEYGEVSVQLRSEDVPFWCQDNALFGATLVLKNPTR